MCTTECAYDQRCNGFEFVATGEVGGVKQGTCKLIDDLPVALTSPGGTSANPSITTQSDLDAASWDSLNGAICYEKNVGCNPYFGADDLNDVMLKCYCPNNRKGFTRRMSSELSRRPSSVTRRKPTSPTASRTPKPTECSTSARTGACSTRRTRELRCGTTTHGKSAGESNTRA